MSERLSPVSWGDLVHKLSCLGFSGPYQVGKHNFMAKDKLRLTIPNPHKKTISVGLLKEVLDRGGISRSDWLKVGKK
ncbi:MAG: type II toxin-antitoxin system HicA family toxin [Chloroflexi bacterium]|nr:type II toxin-antitoxin system HicA family toxin [Chloroflexota bacterium]